MEMKDNLKQLRKSRGITQAQLAEAIFVSRSTVAKWENGLGVPGAESMKALEDYFGITRSEILTSEPEEVISRKNRTFYTILQILGALAAILAVSFSCALPFLIHSGQYGITPDMAAGVFENNPYIDTGDYRIYYTCFEGDWEDGRHWTSLASFRPVEKHFWGYTVSEEDYEDDVILHNYYLVGRLYSIKGKHGYYNILKNVIGNEVQDTLVTATTISIGGVEYEVQHGFFFITPEPVEYFKIWDVFLDVE